MGSGGYVGDNAVNRLSVSVVDWCGQIVNLFSGPLRLQEVTETAIGVIDNCEVTYIRLNELCFCVSFDVNNYTNNCSKQEL